MLAEALGRQEASILYTSGLKRVCLRLRRQEGGGPQEVQAPLGTLAVELVAVHLELSGDSPTLHGFRTQEVATNVEGDVLGAREDGAPDLLPVDEGVALVPEKAQQALESSLLCNKEKDIIMV